MDSRHQTVAPALTIPALASAANSPSWAQLLRHLRGAAYICDAEGYITHFNEAAAETWGRRPQIGREQWCGSHRLFLRDGKPVPREQCPMAHCVRSRTPLFNVEAVCQRPDGTLRVVRVSPSPIFDDDGNFCGAVNEMVDVTEFVEADRARAHLAAIISNSDDAIISKDLDGVILTWNRGAERLFGYSAGEAIGRPVTLLIPPQRMDEEPKVLARIRRGESVEHYDTVRVRKDGSLVDISLSISPIYDSHKQIIGASKIARDITERKRVERALADADRRKDEFIATLAHELRNPLAPLTACLQMIRLAGYDPRRIPRNTLETMERQVNHLVRLVGDLLDLTRLTHGTLELKKERVLISDVISDALEIVTPLIQAKEHCFERSAPGGLQLQGDRTRLVQVLVNLLSNAAKFVPPKGLIQLNVDRQHGCVRFRVTDNGIGIAPENQEAVFGMFSRVRASSDRFESGLGIGLALVRHLVELHGGTVSVHSEGLGRGAEFVILLPLTEDEPPEPVSARNEPKKPSSPRRRVLVVDDNADAVEMMSLLFQSLGHEVRTALSGTAALSLAKEFVPDVVLLDIGLPDISGHEVAARLRQEPWGRSVLLVALTGWGQERDRRLSSAAGFDHHFVKPVDLDALESLLDAAQAVRH